jgi:hypothetical protein
MGLDVQVNFLHACHMSDTKVILDLIEEQRELHRKQLELLDSTDLKKKIEDYRHWSVQLPILKNELEALIGKPLEEPPAAPKEKSPKGRKKGGTSLDVADVAPKVLDLLREEKHSKGLAARHIGLQLKDKWKGVEESTVERKVKEVLDKDQKLPESERKFKRSGSNRSSKWVAV